MPSTILGVPTEIALLWVAALSFGVCAVIFYLSVFRKEQKSELSISLFAFLLNMVLTLFLMGLGMYLGNMVFVNLGVLAFLVASAFMLKFPLTLLPESWRQPIFYAVLVLALLLFIWIVVSPTGARLIIPIVTWLNLGINGLVTGFLIFWVGLKAREKWLRTKATGGGLGVMTCCVAAEVAFLSGALLTNAVLNFISPIILVFSVLLGRKQQKQSNL